uniref:Uncharacterized protein n=1 Tax=Roseihalotalea indica TaxID=2867963 RepID=A0AA49JB90_9BACT|nr:hypothetical protein K4G66_18440 [Tunicatimonas sp. TK19036]
MVGLIGKLWAIECRERGYDLFDTCGHFGTQMQRFSQGTRIRWQDEQLKFGLAFFCSEADYMAYVYSRPAQRLPAKAKSFKRHNSPPFSSDIYQICDVYKKRTTGPEKIKAMEFFHAGTDMMCYYAWHGSAWAQRALERFHIRSSY